MTGRPILVVKLGALGDFVQAMGPFAAIRTHHGDNPITLLTTAPYADLAAASPWFDRVWLDRRPKPWQVAAWAELAGRLRGGGFVRVYDLQTSDRSAWYFRLLGRGVEWSGVARGCSHPHANPRRDFMHTVDRQAEQLAMAGIAEVPPPDLSWVPAETESYGLPDRFALIVPGGAPHRPGKRWPAEAYGALCRRLAEAGIAPVLLGTGRERAELAAIGTACPQAVDLMDRTSFLDIAGLARRAELAVGNDTGPMHLAAAAGCRSVVLFSGESDPTLCAPRGRVTVLRRERLSGLAVDEVAAVALT